MGEEIPADDANRIPMRSRSLIVRGGGRVILVDTGVGDKLSDKLKKIYDIQTPAGSMAKRLAPFGLRVEDITDVILTHLHFDHAGGSTVDSDDAVVPGCFPTLSTMCSRDQRDVAANPSVGPVQLSAGKLYAAFGSWCAENPGRSGRRIF
ncbi:MAG: MBL fold metallo-hydrolase [Desulfobacterales bacterium]